jgi:succinate dehydrogenase / fumarate reductase iron-sulfur subunit
MSQVRRMKLNLMIWRQSGPTQPGKFVTYPIEDVSADMSFLEMLDHLNEKLAKKGELPVEFDSDCREGICGSCGVVINGQAHGPWKASATCQLHMRAFKDGDNVIIEPWRARAFPVIKDLVVDRGALDRIISAGGYTSAKSGKHIDGNAILIGKDTAEKAMDMAECIGCGACVAACPNASASLFTAAKIAQMSLLPQGQVEKGRRVQRMVKQMDQEGFGNCTNIGECQAACPKDISIEAIAIMRTEYIKATRAQV